MAFNYIQWLVLYHYVLISGKNRNGFLQQTWKNNNQEITDLLQYWPMFEIFGRKALRVTMTVISDIFKFTCNTQVLLYIIYIIDIVYIVCSQLKHYSVFIPEKLLRFLKTKINVMLWEIKFLDVWTIIFKSCLYLHHVEFKNPPWARFYDNYLDGSSGVGICFCLGFYCLTLILLKPKVISHICRLIYFKFSSWYS